MRDVEGLLYEVKDGVAYLTLNRPEKLNAATQAMYRGIEYFILSSESNDAVQMTVIRAAGDRAFCPGGDLSEGAAWDENALIDAISQSRNGFPFHCFERQTKLIICAVNGLAQAAGLIMTLMCDIAIASEQARFRVPELLRGLADPFIPVRLYQYVGLARAKWMLYTAEELSAQEALAAGLIAKVVPHEQLNDAVEETIAKIKRTAPKARGYYKRMVSRALGDVPVDIFMEAMRNPEGMEGMKAFAEKRAPAWAPDAGGRL